MTASPSPLRPSALALLITAVVTGAFCTVAVVSAEPDSRAVLGWSLGIAAALLSAGAYAVTHSVLRNRVLRERLAALNTQISAQEANAARRSADAVRLDAAQAAERKALIAAHAAELRRAESSRAAALAATANAAGRMQALATGMLADLRDMEHRHADEDVLGDLLHLDHRTAQAGRLADSIAVLTGARSGRRWARPIVMESILRGAMGRIGGYQRVRLHSTSDAAVAGHAAEGVMHALAELLDNAANFSPPTAEVHVYVEEVPAGVIITVEDSGLVMSDVQLRRAEQAVSGRLSDLAGLSGTRLGLAVVGRLARKHGLTVSFRPSARGGTGALMLLPHELVTHVAATPTVAPLAPALDVPQDLLPPQSATEESRTPAPAAIPASASVSVSAQAPAPDGEPEATHEPAAEPASGTGTARPAPAARTSGTGRDTGTGAGSETSGEFPQFGESGLPKRKRGRALAAAHPEGPDAPAAPARATNAASDAAARFSSFRQAVRANSPTPEGNSE
ncbi:MULTISPECIES: sensor histidine kinase [Streptomyces]|uniref:histidine kinase n=1 Tax=Streptomyces xanthochromogenes TaxID=67384 RepID=A0ABQ3A0I5_9ACTN|nr:MULTISPECIES: ATP-binding protein [Streptomyces]MYV94225.1 ATP-binding protein [Streptomyces sp. SID1034]GGY28474.1 histidine kinase [Streptomyces xanthochromogenes]